MEKTQERDFINWKFIKSLFNHLWEWQSFQMCFVSFKILGKFLRNLFEKNRTLNNSSIRSFLNLFKFITVLWNLIVSKLFRRMSRAIVDLEESYHCEGHKYFPVGLNQMIFLHFLIHVNGAFSICLMKNKTLTDIFWTISKTFKKLVAQFVEKKIHERHFKLGFNLEQSTFQYVFQFKKYS